MTIRKITVLDAYSGTWELHGSYSRGSDARVVQIRRVKGDYQVINNKRGRYFIPEDKAIIEED